MKKNRILCCLPVFLLGLFLLAVTAYGTEYDYRGEMDSFFREGGPGELLDKVPEGARDLLDGDASGTVSDMVESFTPSVFLEKVWRTFRENLRAPVRLLVSLAGVLVLCALLESFGTSFSSGGVEAVFGVIVTVFISSIILDPIVGCIIDAREVIRDFGVFILTFIPVFAGLVTASGQPMTGAAYNLFLFWMCQVTARLVTAVFLPLLCAYLAQIGRAHV